LQIQTDNDEKDYRLVEEADSEALAAFLRNIEPVISKVLSKNLQSTAFDGRTWFIFYYLFGYYTFFSLSNVSSKIPSRVKTVQLLKFSYQFLSKYY